LRSKDEEKKEGQLEEKKVGYFKLYSYATGFDVFLIIVGSLASMAVGATMPSFSLIFGELIDALAKPPNELIDRISYLAVIFALIGVASMIVNYLQKTCFTIAAERQVFKLRRDYIAAVLKQDVGWFDQIGTGKLTSRISGDISLIQEAIGEKFGALIQFLTMFLYGFVLGFIRGWQLTLVLLAVTPVLAICGALMMKIMSSFSEKGQKAYADAGSVATEVLSGIKTVMSFTGEEKEVDRYRVNLDKAEKIGRKKGFLSGLGIGATMFIFFASYGLALWYGGELIVKNEYTGGKVLTVIFSVLIGAFALGQATPSLEAISKGQGVAYHIFETINRQPAVDSSSSKGETLESISGNVEMKGLHFTYPTRPDVPVLQGLNLKIKAGQKVALVGPSGCGKSSTVGLIERFYDPAQGTITVDGVDIRELNVKWWRQQIGLVGQEPVLFAGTIAENIAYGKEGASKKEIRAAAKLANAHKFIKKFPSGYDTFVGEKGAQLSGGQKQRIAIARAIIKNPKILLLDEATSALDSESEKVVQKALDKIMKGRTTIVIAHRLSTIRDADNIAVFQEGKVAELGKHDELMKLDGTYKRLVLLQGGGHGVTEDTEKKSKTKLLVESIDKKKPTDSDSNEDTDDKKKKKKKKDDVSLARLIKYNTSHIPYMLIGALAAAGNGIMNPVFSIIFSELITVYFGPPSEISTGTVKWALIFLAIATGALIVNVLQAGMFGIAGEALTKKLREVTFTKILKQDVSFFDKEENAASLLASRLASDTTLVEGIVGTRLAILTQNVVTLIAALVIAFINGWKLTLVLLALSPLIIFSNAAHMMAMKGLTAKSQDANAKANQIAVEAVGNIRTVASFASEIKIHERYVAELHGPMKLAIRKSHLGGFLTGLGQFFLFGTFALAFWYGGQLISQGEMDFNQVMKVFFAITLSAQGIGQAAGFAPDAGKAQAATQAIFRLIDAKPKVDVDAGGKKNEKVKGSISLKNIQFSYPNRPNIKIFNNLSLDIEPGKVVALVGESGGGKSTVVSMLERFYDPDEGQVVVDGVDLREFDLKWWRQQVGLVGQEPVLFAGSIAENIAYGKPGASQEEIEGAAKMANAHKFISSFPEGYNTFVGEKGTQLSGGQKQRIAIARAIIKNPKVLLLDEATSALDTQSEKVVQKALDKVMKGRTTIVIAHRLSTIKDADVIYVLAAGKVVEKGRHDELLEKGGLYHSLVQRQTA